jgi:outer membrane lipoprotein-sorting protein
VLAGLLVGCSASGPEGKATEESTRKAKAVYAEVVNKLSKANTVSFNYHLVIDDHDQGNFNDGTYTFQKPGLSRTETSDNIRITDNEKSTNIFLSLNEYRQRSIIHGSEEADFELFGFDPIVLGKATPTSVQPLLTTLEGKQVVLTRLRDGSNQVEVYYSVDTKLPVKCVIKKPGFLIWSGEKKAYTYCNVALNRPVSKDLFTVDYKRYKPMDVYEGQIDSSKIGTQCADFEITTIESERIRLIDELKTQKAMILTFWSHG